MTAETFFYGDYQHPPGEVAFASIIRNIIYSQTQRANLLREAWSMKGKIVKQGATSQSQIFSALASTRQVYSVNGYSAGLLDMNGAQTPFFLDTTQAIGGVIVTSPISHGDLSGSETATFLHYTFGLMGDTFKSSISDLLSYTERVTFADNRGGPLQIGRVPIFGNPIIQSVSSASFYYATQSGSASSRDPNIQAEAMIWPDSLIGEDGSYQVTPVSAVMERGVPISYSISWSYRFRSIVPFVGSPHNRG
jgi:hypothetical protein